ncbi:MAG TPA: vitamin K epoxide reductase family protein [Candidatus Paceibacterota bacterium]|nr:vitamin K epoxide reductase family protein [Candidatus Paceibacterota bacterium]
MTSIALLFTLSSIGISETIYLIRKRVAAEQPICPIGGNCAIVLTSKYSKFFIIPNDILGLITYIIISVIAAFLVIGVSPIPLWSMAIKILVSIASIMSFVFTYLQWRVIRAWCFWCLMSACTIWLMGIIILVSGNI